ncbi:hypothetical protein Bbelb_284930 [Branchiostoma belcheri]|nr:hypothetical protein Bbelb_284930 [Branchiostoma belcheri]
MFPGILRRHTGSVRNSLANVPARNKPWFFLPFQPPSLPSFTVNRLHAREGDVMCGMPAAWWVYMPSKHNIGSQPAGWKVHVASGPTQTALATRYVCSTIVMVTAGNRHGNTCSTIVMETAGNRHGNACSRIIMETAK